MGAIRSLRERERVNEPRGIPIGNLTSQIFANIYLNEFDRFVKHTLRPQFYLRYGDDFIIITPTRIVTEKMRFQAIEFIQIELGLEINRRNDIIVPAKRGIHFLGVDIFPQGRRLKRRNWQRAVARINPTNAASYHGFVGQHSQEKRIKEFDWIILEKLFNKGVENYGEANRRKTNGWNNRRKVCRSRQ